jgi:hypothetical protein
MTASFPFSAAPVAFVEVWAMRPSVRGAGMRYQIVLVQPDGTWDSISGLHRTLAAARGDAATRSEDLSWPLIEGFIVTGTWSEALDHPEEEGDHAFPGS